MFSASDWKACLTSSDRYDNITAIKSALESSKVSQTNSQADAFAIENDAYQSSSSRAQYDAACQVQLQPGAIVLGQSEDDAAVDETPESPGITIGRFQHCHYVASGVTAEVYRSKTIALKVIVETRNIEPHSPSREAKILGLLKTPCIPLLETFRDQEQRFTLAFPFMPLSLESLIERGPIPEARIRSHFTHLFNALSDIHAHGIIHRDIKPSAVLLASVDGPAYLSDFGTAWHPQLSAYVEPPDEKILDIGTGPYRAPEALFGNKSYGTAVDLWGAGVMLAECCRQPSKPLFESRAAHEDGNQLGLILSIFKTIGSPTPETWPDATRFKTPPFEMYQAFEGRGWEELLQGVYSDFRELIAALVKYDSGKRATAVQALQSVCLLNPSHDSGPQ
ncbi:kinase-like domain-containing protein [Xylariaceae sp. FL0804]|nr:kinase-like domain-containing protein [Xylariaceae sp. FL0804]